MRLWTVLLLVVLLTSCAKNKCSVRPGADVDIDSLTKEGIVVSPKGEMTCSF
jgi:hypothetical protein|tara:strand:+ start:400 stop:555 length:156 start_codon:yes stop_codon:yes gene_type:complete